jgi:uncharacterized membrane protein
MTKHRLELFSDGVFAIVLTLLVLDLRVPTAHGLAGLWEIIPALLVHAASFLVVASLWLSHHGVLARVTEINSRTLRLNLVCLFWITLIPFGARNAAGHPTQPLGASLTAAATGFGVLSLLRMRLSAHSTIDDNPRLESYRRRQVATVFTLGAVDAVGSALAWITPWPAYAATIATAIFLLTMPSPAEVEQRAGTPTDEPAPSVE